MADHLVSGKTAGKATWTGIGGYRNALNVKDFLFKHINCYPIFSKGDEEVICPFRDFCGDREMGRVFSDHSGELIKATKACKVPHEVSQPGVPVGSPIAERSNSIIQQATTAILGDGECASLLLAIRRSLRVPAHQPYRA